MNILKKQKEAPQAQAQNLKEAHASPSAPDAAAVIGGLDWYRTQFHRVMKLALGLTVALCLCSAVTALLLLNQPKRGHAGFAACPHDPA